MTAYVITIMDNRDSLLAAQRCMASAPPNKIKHFPAITPNNDLDDLVKKNGITNLYNFEKDGGSYSRYENCLAAFLSHFHLWKKARDENETMLILEHDAIFINNLPEIKFNKVCTIGKPSYGRYYTPQFLGVGKMSQAPYMKGAHAYVVSPAGASELIEKAKTHAGPTDVFLHIANFPWLQEYYPWVVEAKDTFTTIQNPNGCAAKHNYNEDYKIVRVGE
tara:strand:+ start:529 stop:1188 length:660 start_codon:yes stop_codon:yes gene_type:complete